MKGLVQENVSAGLNLDKRRLNSQMIEFLLNDLCLPQGQRAAATPDDQLFRQDLYASRVASMTSSV
jgi:hypothetical protein